MHFEACTLENVNFVLIKEQMQEELGLLQRWISCPSYKVEASVINLMIISFLHQQTVK